LTTDAQGRYRSSALWPTDSYAVKVTAPGFGNWDSKWSGGVAGKTETIDVRLLAIMTVKGRVVDTAGNPLAKVNVFNRGDGEQALGTITDAAGQFTLGGYVETPAFVSARLEGYRLVSAPADPDGAAVTLTLRKTTEPHLPPADIVKHKAALAEMTRQMFEMMWNERAALGGFQGRTFEDFARFDWAGAKKLADKAKADEGNEVLLQQLARHPDKFAGIAKADPEKALALLGDRGGTNGCWEVLQLAVKVRPLDAKKALRIAEEAATRARALAAPERARFLARAGFLVGRCGNLEAAKAIVREAADLADTMPAAKDGSYGDVAAYLAPFDPARGFPMIAALRDAEEHEQRYADAIDRVGAFDIIAAQKLLAAFPAGGRTFARDYAHIGVAYRLAATNADAAVQMIASVKHRQFRTLAYVDIAKIVAAKDKLRAWKVLDTALAEYAGEFEYDEPDGYNWNSEGGRAALFAIVAATGRQIDYPDVADVVARAISDRPLRYLAESPRAWAGQRARVALALSFVDPAAARRVLASIGEPEIDISFGELSKRDWLFTIAFVTPERALPLIRAQMRNFRAGGSGLTELPDALAAADPFRNAAIWAQLPRLTHEWED
jgi:hypothetical protein